MHRRPVRTRRPRHGRGTHEVRAARADAAAGLRTAGAARRRERDGGTSRCSSRARRSWWPSARRSCSRRPTRGRSGTARSATRPAATPRSRSGASTAAAGRSRSTSSRRRPSCSRSGVAFVPRRDDVVGLAALAGAILVAMQLATTYWFYLYLVWVVPMALIAFLGRLPADEPLTAPAGPKRQQHLLDRRRPSRLRAPDEHGVQPRVVLGVSKRTCICVTSDSIACSFFTPITPPRGAGHPDVRDVGRPAREDPRVGGRDVRVRPDDGGDAAVQVPAHRDLLARGLGVHVDEDLVAAGLRRARSRPHRPPGTPGARRAGTRCPTGSRRRGARRRPRRCTCRGPAAPAGSSRDARCASSRSRYGEDLAPVVGVVAERDRRPRRRRTARRRASA